MPPPSLPLYPLHPQLMGDSSPASPAVILCHSPSPSNSLLPTPPQTLLHSHSIHSLIPISSPPIYLNPTHISSVESSASSAVAFSGTIRVGLAVMSEKFKLGTHLRTNEQSFITGQRPQTLAKTIPHRWGSAHRDNASRGVYWTCAHT